MKTYLPIQSVRLIVLLAFGSSTHSPAAVLPASPPAKGAQVLANNQRTDFVLRNLDSEFRIPGLRGLISNCVALPRTTELVPTTWNGQPVRLAVHRLGETSGRVTVFLHGVLSDGMTWRFVAGELGKREELWLIDLPGCGDSDKPDPHTLGAGGYSPAALVERTLQAIEHCVKGRTSAPKITVVGHSLGGMVALRAFAHPELSVRYADVLRHIDNLVLFSPCDVVVNQEVPQFVQVAELKCWQVGLGTALGILPNATAAVCRDGYVNLSLASREEAERFSRCFTERSRLRAAQAMIRDAVPWDFAKRAPDWQGIEEQEAWYSRVNVPVLIVWGRRDQTLSEAMGYKLACQLPMARLKLVANAMHSTHLEFPAQSAAIIREFSATGAAALAGLHRTGGRQSGPRTVMIEEHDWPMTGSDVQLAEKPIAQPALAGRAP